MTRILAFIQASTVSESCEASIVEAMHLARKAALRVPGSELYSVERESICQLVDDCMSAVYVADLKTDDLLYVNHAGERLFHKRFDPKKKKKCYEYVANRTSPCPDCPKKSMPKKGFSDAHIYSDALHRYFHVNGKKLDWNGTPAHVQYLSDVTNAIVEPDGAHRILDEVKVGLGVGSVYHDGKIELSILNNGYYAMLGTTRDERRQFANFSVTQAIAPADRDTVIHEAQLAARLCKSFDLVFRVSKPDGNVKWINLRGCFLEQDSVKTVYDCVLLDVDRFMQR